MNEADTKLSVRFFLHPVENHKKTKEAGRPIYDDVEMVSIMAPGNTKTEHTARAHAMHYDSNVQKQWTYAERFKEHYRDFKDGVEEQGSGTPLAEAPFLSVSQKAEMHAMKIRTVEQLAGMSDRNIRAKGMGFREHVDAAKAYLDTAQGTSALAGEMAELRRQLAELQASAPKQETQTAPMGFESYEDEDLRAMLSDAGVDVDGRWGRARLEDEMRKLAKEKEAA